MAIFCRSDLVCGLRFLFVYVACASYAFGGINLDRLNACDDIATLNESLRSTPMPKSSECRSPIGALENSLYERSGGRHTALCFLRSTPAPFLEGFSCAQTPSKTGAAITCFRSARLADIKFYKENYKDRFADLVSKYQVSASKCTVTNGNATVAVPTTFPPLLTFISTFEFGFISPLGEDRRTDSFVQHGYASTAPSIAGEAPSALEYVYLLIGTTPYASNDKKQTIGDWVVNVDESEEADKEFSKEFRKRNIPMIINSTSYHLENLAGSNYSLSEKLKLIDGLQNVIVKGYEDEGFEEMSDDYLKSETGRNRDELITDFAKLIPYGTAVPMKLGRTIHILMNEKRPSCTRNGAGVVGVYLFSFQPVSEVESDFGDIVIMVAGIGDCSKSLRASTTTYMKGLVEVATELVTSELVKK